MISTTMKRTYADYLETSDDERYELLHGELVMAPAPLTDHQLVVMELGSQLHTFVKDRGLGAVLSAPTDVVLSDTDVVQPDILFVSNERRYIRTRENIQGAPDLVVEILSPATAERDRSVKFELYAQHSVQEYWIVDPDARTITVFLLNEGAFEEVDTYSAGETLTSPMLAGFSIALDEIFGDIEEA